MNSWKTTLCGALTALGAYLATLHDPAWLVSLGKLLAMLAPAAGLILARDNDKTSEAVGAPKA